jgi:hypothetical protein
VWLGALCIRSLNSSPLVSESSPAYSAHCRRDVLWSDLRVGVRRQYLDGEANRPQSCMHDAAALG